MAITNVTEPTQAANTPSNRKLKIVVGAVVAFSLLLAASALISGVGVETDGEIDEDDVVYPRDLPDGPVRKRTSTRDSPAEPAEAKDNDPPIALPKALPRLDAEIGTAVQRAVGVPGKTALIFDVAAMVHSPLAEKLLKCRGDRATTQLANMQKTTGLSLKDDVEQLGMSDGVIALGGRLGGLKTPEGSEMKERYGTDARLYERAGKKPGEPSVWFAAVGDGLLLSGKDPDALKRAVDRAEGRAPSQLLEGGHADVRGTLATEDLKELLGRGANPDSPSDPQLQAIAALAKSVDLRMNVEDHVALSLDVKTGAGDDAHDLAAAMKSMVTIGRKIAENKGLKKTAWLMDQARIADPKGENLALDLAVPAEFILKAMGCDPDGNPLEQAPPLDSPAAPTRNPPAAPTPDASAATP